MTEERKVAVRDAIASFRSILGEADFGDCEGCGWAIYSTFAGKGPPSKLIVRDCKGFDDTGKPIGEVNCLLVQHLRAMGKLNSSDASGSAG